MSFVTNNVAKYVRDKGFNISKMSRETGIPYNALSASLMSDSRDRDLRDDELIKICMFIGVNPMDFAEEKVV